MKTIQLPSMNWKSHPKIFAGNRERYSTATAVSFIDENLILAASFFGKKLYLINTNTEEIIDEVNTKHYPDLMDYRDGFILTSDYPYKEPNGHASVYHLIDNKIKYQKEIVLKRTKAHGCRVIDNKNIVITSNSDDSRGCLFIDTEKKEIIKNFNEFIGYPKDVFFTEDKLLVLTAESLPNIGSKVVVKRSYLYLFDRHTLEKIDEINFDGQTDSLTLDGEDGFITLQAEDSVLHFNLKDNKLIFRNLIRGFDFPHGISSHNNNIAVTNYGDNTVRIFEKTELIKFSFSS